MTGGSRSKTMESKIRLNWFAQGDAAQQLYMTYNYSILWWSNETPDDIFCNPTLNQQYISWIDPFLTIFLVPKIYNQNSLPLFCHDLQSSYTFSATTLLTGMLGSGMVGCDARLQVRMLKVSMGGIAGGDIHRASQHFKQVPTWTLQGVPNGW